MIEYNKYIISPLLTEKTTSYKDQNKYCFKVYRTVSKSLLKKAIEHIFGVSVLRCNVLNVKKRKNRRSSKNARSQKCFKKAIISLKEGDAFDFYGGI